MKFIPYGFIILDIIYCFDEDVIFLNIPRVHTQ